MLSAYLNPDRHYHHIGHIGDCLRQFTEMTQVYGDRMRNREELIAATLYHDCVYDATSKENERLSAEAAIAAYPNLNAVAIRDIVMATKHKGGPLAVLKNRFLLISIWLAWLLSILNSRTIPAKSARNTQW